MKKFAISAIAALISAFILPAAPDNAETDALLVDAVSLYNEGDYAGARDRLLSLTSLSGNNDASFYYLGLCDFYLGNLEDAERSLKRAVSLDSGNFWYRERLAVLYAATSRPELAVEVYEELLKDFPKNVNLYYSLVSLYGELGKPDSILNTLAEIDAVAGKSEMVAMVRYNVLSQTGKEEEAFASLEEFNRDYTSAQVLSVMGDAKLSRYEDSLALGYYGDALACEPLYAPALLGKSEVYRMRRDYPRFFEAAGEFLAAGTAGTEEKTRYVTSLLQHSDPNFIRNFLPHLDTLMSVYRSCAPNDSTVLQTAGSYYYATERQIKAGECFSKNRNLYPESLSARLIYIQYLVSSRNWTALLSESEQGFGDFPEEADFLKMKSFAFYNLQDYPSAISEYERIVAGFPGDKGVLTDAYAGMGDLYHLLGNSAKAYKAYEKALKLDPSNAAVLNNYAYYLCLEGRNMKKAEQMSRTAVEKEPDNATYLDTLGWILYLRGQCKEAKTHFKRAMLYGGKEEATILDHYAEVLYALGDFDLAKVYWNMAVSKNKGGEIPDLESRIEERMSSIRK